MIEKVVDFFFQVGQVDFPSTPAALKRANLDKALQAKFFERPVNTGNFGQFLENFHKLASSKSLHTGRSWMKGVTIVLQEIAKIRVNFYKKINQFVRQVSSLQ